MFFFHSQLLLGQFLNGPDRYQIPFDHDPYSIANPLDLIQKVGGKKNGNIPVPAQGVDEVEHPVGSIRVKPNGRLIKEDELRLFDQDFCDPESLPHPLRIGSHLLLALFEKADLLEQFVNLFARDPIRDSVQTGDEPEILPGIHIVVETDVFWQVPDFLFHAERLTGWIESHNTDLPGGGLCESQKHEQRGGFPCPIGAKEPEHLPFLNLKSKAVHGDLSSILLRQPFGFDDDLPFQFIVSLNR